jgi:sugar/nucleoside kinase (ribokinase family)
MHVDFVASDICGVPEIVLIDGYNLKDNLKVVADWKRNGAIIVMDGGSWKDNSWDALQLVDIAICSNRFRIPNLGKGQTTHELHRMGVDMVAITHEGDPIEISMKGRSKTITVPHVNAVDTLGAGDVLHGAFCYYYKNNMDFQKSIELAAVDASKSCKYFGTHVWVGK